MELEDSIYKQIKFFCKEGDRLANKKNYKESLLKYELALKLIPAPDIDWEATTWIYAAIGDAYFFMEDNKEEALNAFLYAYKCPGGTTNPFINLRLGQCYFDLDDQLNAEEYLLRAYMWEGKNIFKREAKRYIDFMSEKYKID